MEMERILMSLHRREAALQKALTSALKTIDALKKRTTLTPVEYRRIVRLHRLAKDGDR